MSFSAFAFEKSEVPFDNVNVLDEIYVNVFLWSGKIDLHTE